MRRLRRGAPRVPRAFHRLVANECSRVGRSEGWFVRESSSSGRRRSGRASGRRRETATRGARTHPSRTPGSGPSSGRTRPGRRRGLGARARARGADDDDDARGPRRTTRARATDDPSRTWRGACGRGGGGSSAFGVRDVARAVRQGTARVARAFRRVRGARDGGVRFCSSYPADAAKNENAIVLFRLKALL